MRIHDPLLHTQSHPSGDVRSLADELADELARTDRLITNLAHGIVPSEFLHDDLAPVYLELARDVAALDRSPGKWPLRGC